MSYLEIDSTQVATEASHLDVVWSERRTVTFQCLVAAANQTMREMMARSANEAGWDAVVCADASDAQAKIQRERVQMALVDLQDLNLNETATFRELVEQLASSPDVLLVLFGNQGDALEEIWARQLGTWLYLPGVDVDRDLMSLCADALPVAEKLTGETAARAS